MQFCRDRQYRRVGSLIEDGFRPNVVTLPAWTWTLHQGFNPDALHVGYFEWYFKSVTTQHLLASFDLNAQLKSGLRNLPILQELECCDKAVVLRNGKNPSFQVPIRTN